MKAAGAWRAPGWRALRWPYASSGSSITGEPQARSKNQRIDDRVVSSLNKGSPAALDKSRRTSGRSLLRPLSKRSSRRVSRPVGLTIATLRNDCGCSSAASATNSHDNDMPRMSAGCVKPSVSRCFTARRMDSTIVCGVYDKGPRCELPKPGNSSASTGRCQV